MKYDLIQYWTESEEHAALTEKIGGVQGGVGALNRSIEGAEAELRRLEAKANELAVSIELGEGSRADLEAVETKAAELRRGLERDRLERSRKSKALEILNERLGAVREKLKGELRAQLLEEYEGAARELVQKFLAFHAQNERVEELERTFRHISTDPPHEPIAWREFVTGTRQVHGVNLPWTAANWLETLKKRGYYEPSISEESAARQNDQRAA